MSICHGSPKEYRPLFQAFADLGWTIELSRSQHWKLRSPDRREMLVISYTPRCASNTIHKMRSRLRRLGVKVA